MPRSWAACTTSAMSSKNGTNSAKGIGPLAFRYAPSVTPRTNSIAIHRKPSSSTPTLSRARRTGDRVALPAAPLRARSDPSRRGPRPRRGSARLSWGPGPTGARHREPLSATRWAELPQRRALPAQPTRTGLEPRRSSSTLAQCSGLSCQRWAKRARRFPATAVQRATDLIYCKLLCNERAPSLPGGVQHIGDMRGTCWRMRLLTMTRYGAL